MTVKEMIEKLQELDPDIDIIIPGYDAPDKIYCFEHVKTVEEDWISGGENDIDYKVALIYAGEWW